ncbi:MAG: metallopeptidase TldD-related protein [Actinobacteria bacterium]|nr:metallopeptidase TldD-related protein [Actinomycetota bacterium]
MISPQELIERITAAADYEDCIVIVKESTQANLRWANSTLTTNGVIEERSVTVIAFVAVDGGIASGTVTRTDVEAHEIASVAAEAATAARGAGKAADASVLSTDESVGSWRATHQPTGPEVFSKIAPALGEMFERSSHDAIELFGYAEHTHLTTWVGSKGGLRLRWDQPVGRIEMTGKSHQRSRSTWEGVATRDFSNVSIADIDAVIRQRLTWQAKKIEIPPGRYDTVLPSGSVGDILAYMLWTSGARDAYEGQSAFSGKGASKTRIGEKLSNHPTNLYSDSTYPGLESIPFIAASASGPMSSVFDNGIPLTRTNWLTGGSLTALAQTRASAVDTKLPFTPVGENIIMEVPGARGSLEDLVSGVKDGLLVTTLWYIRLVDPSTLLLTGLTRDGVYRVKDGEVIGAVNNFRWNESPIDLLSRIKAVGATEITQPREWAEDIDRVATPPVVFENFNMSTVSKAN